MTAERDDSPLIRAFIAIPIDKASRTALAAVQSDMKASGADARWVSTQNIHITLVFLGDIRESMSSTIGEKLAPAVSRVAPFTLKTAGLGFFGSPSAPRVIYAGLMGDTGKLAALHEQTLKAARSAGCRPDERPFKPHITLGRVKSRRNAKPLLRALESEKDTCFGEFLVQNVLLMKSRLTPGGPEYSVLREFRLGETMVSIKLSEEN